jgi:hypothetical protein
MEIGIQVLHVLHVPQADAAAPESDQSRQQNTSCLRSEECGHVEYACICQEGKCFSCGCKLDRRSRLAASSASIAIVSIRIKITRDEGVSSVGQRKGRPIESAPAVSFQGTSECIAVQGARLPHSNLTGDDDGLE